MSKWNYLFEVPEQKKFRVIVHTDCKNEADDQFAVAHHLMTDKFIVEGIIAGHFDINARNYGKGNTAQASLDEVNLVLDLMGVQGDYRVAKGAGTAISDEHTPIDSEGARLIIEEAMKESDKPLFILMQGAVTDLACAILMEPKICDRMTCVWIGGGDWPKGGFEFNLMNDIHAANVLFKSTMPLWQVPMGTYKQMAVSLAELQLKVRPHGKIGKYLFTQMVDFNNMCAEIRQWPHGEIWGLGDQGTIAVLMEESEKNTIYDMKPAPTVNVKDMTYIHGESSREIRVYRQLDPRIVLEDFFCKMAINFPEQDS